MKEYGLLYYDIPANNMDLYKEVKRVVNATCLPVNMSVYAFDWGLKSTIEKRLKDLNAFNLCSIAIMKFDNTSVEDLERIAGEQLQKIFTAISSRIAVSMVKFKDKIKKKQTLNRLSKKLTEYESLLQLYSFANRAEQSLQILRDVIKHEREVLDPVDAPVEADVKEEKDES